MLPPEAKKRKAEPVLLPEDRIEFTEKVAAVKKKTNIAPFEFKKKRTNMRIRQRDDDDD